MTSLIHTCFALCSAATGGVNLQLRDVEMSDAGVISVSVGAQHSELTLVVKGNVLDHVLVTRMTRARSCL